MAGYRFWLQSSLSVFLALTIVQAGRSQTDVPQTPPIGALAGAGLGTLVGGDAGRAGSTCKVYSLSDLGDDPNLCKWIAETIPEMIQPGSWKQNGAKLNYYAPSKILVVNHTSAVHTQVDEFLQSLKKSLPQQKAMAYRTKYEPSVLPAQFSVQDPTRHAGPVQTGPSSYPVPFPPQAPRHLFHFIIRYEGEGVIDSNVVKFAKALSSESSSNTSKEAGPTTKSSTPGTVPPQYLSQPAQYFQYATPTADQPTPTRSTPVMPPADLAPARVPPSAPQPSSSSAPVRPMPPADPVLPAELPSAQSPPPPVVPTVPGARQLDSRPVQGPRAPQPPVVPSPGGVGPVSSKT